MKIAVVTGASSGMGAEAARQIDRMYRNLDEIWLIARRKDCLQETAAALQTKARVIDLDLSKKSSCHTLQKLFEKEKPSVRVLANAAGFGMIGTAEEIKPETQIEMIDVNCRGLTYVTLLCLPYMKNGSRILQFASAAAFMPQPGFGVYAATKSYVLSFSRSLSEELKKRGIIVTAVCPGPVDTAFFDTASRYHTAGVLKKLAMASPEKVVRQALIDSLKHRKLSVYGVPMRTALFFTKTLPHSMLEPLLSKIMMTR